MKNIESISDLTLDERNANRGSERGAKMLGDSLVDFGAGRSILVDKNGKVIAGNKTLQSAIDAGLEIETIRTTGDKLIVVQREDLDLDGDGKARLLAYADNRIAEVSLDWDNAIVAEDMNAGIGVDQFFTDDELGALLNGPSFSPTGEGDQGRLDQNQKEKIICPKCSHEFTL